MQHLWLIKNNQHSVRSGVCVPVFNENKANELRESTHFRTIRKRLAAFHLRALGAPIFFSLPPRIACCKVHRCYSTRAIET